LLIIRDLAFSHKRYFRDFLRSSEGIASNILADRLRTLEASGIVSKRSDPANARKIIYELTSKGEDLIPALLELGRWGAKYDRDTAAPKHYIRRIETDREGFIADIKSFLAQKRTDRP
jgi:DNA-binding HxlR family transcriptional regulator